MPIAKRIQHNDWHDFPMDHFLIFVGLWSCDDSHQTNNTHSRHTPNNIPRRLRRHGDIYFHRRYPLRLWWVHSDHTGWRNNGDRHDIPARVCTLSCHRRATGVASTIVHRAHMPCTNNTWLVSVMAFGSSEAATPHRGDLFLDRRWNKILFHFEFEREGILILWEELYTVSGLKNNRTPVCQKHTDRECQRTAKAPYDLGHIFHAWIDSFEAIGNDTKTLIATTSILPTVTAIISDTIISYIHDIYNVWYMIYGRVRRIRSFFFENLGSFVDVYDTVCNNKKLYFKFKCWWRQNKMFKSFNINRLIGAC